MDDRLLNDGELESDNLSEVSVKKMDEHTRLMFNSTPLCCNLWSSNFSNMRCNDEAVRLFELSSQREYLDRFDELSPKYQPNGRLSSELSREYIIKAFYEGYWRFEWMHQKLDGTPIPSEVTLVRIRYEDDFIVAGYTRDLREEKAMLAELKNKEALRIARDEALMNSKAKSNFLANMSHEIRTPMNAICGFADIILRDSPNAKITKYARNIKDACNNLINIVNDILDITKIESGKIEITSSPYEFSSLLNDTITISRMRLGNKPLRFTTYIDSHLPAQMIGDEIRIKQILINMLSNAIKYTNQGYIELRVFGERKQNQVLLHFSVKDSGVGIKEKDLAHLFDEFERVNTTRNRNIEGTGLGLAISKQLCELMGGSITVESTYGQGSVFTATIPQEYSTYQRLAQVEDRKHVLLYEPRKGYVSSIRESLENLECSCVCCSNQTEFDENMGEIPYDYVLTSSLHLKKVQSIMQKNQMPMCVAAYLDYGETVNDCNVYTMLLPVNCLQLAALLNGGSEEDYALRHEVENIRFIAPSARILIVDDNPVNLQVAKGLLEPYQAVVDVAENGARAVNMVKKTVYDLVFMDHMMPEMDGVDATRAIRKMEENYYQNLPIIALTANALMGTREIFIHEGMNDFLSKPIEINKLIRMLLKWLPQSKIEIALVSKAPAFQKELTALTIEGVDTVKGIASIGGSIENYLQILSIYYTDGRQKISLLRKYLKEQNISAFRTEVHALKSASATLGAFQVSSMAKKLETAAQSNDILYINRKIDEFLISFQAVLEAIGLVLPADQIQRAADDNKSAGDPAYLKSLLGVLKEATEFANIGLVEAHLNQLQSLTWPKEIDKELSAMRDYLNMFDYDGILECMERLNELL